MSIANSKQRLDRPVATTSLDADQEMVEGIKRLAPWHQALQLTESVNTGSVFSADGQILDPTKNRGVTLVDLRAGFLKQIDSIYPDGLDGKRFLDCACNAGAYCFFACERNVGSAFGFDIREKWIRQAEFVKANRDVASTGCVQFAVMDLYEIPKLELPPFDITMFKGIFYHLPDPVTGLKIAADLTNEVLFLDTATTWGKDDGALHFGWEDRDHPMLGKHGLFWLPTGPSVLANILTWLGFAEIKLTYFRQNQRRPDRGRIRLVAARREGHLENLDGQLLTVTDTK